MTTYRLFPSTNGPAAATAFSGAYQAGVAFEVTSGGIWFDGFWWWVAASGQQVTPVTFALWEIVGAGSGGPLVVPGSAVTSGTLTAGQWNYVPLATPIALSQLVGYVAVAGYQSTTGFPLTGAQFGSGQPYSAGITQGPLFAYSDTSGSAPAPSGQSQGLFGTGAASGASASANYPGSGSNGSANFWVDVQVSNVAPPGAAYQLWPSQPFPINQGPDTADNFTLGTEFLLSAPCTLNKILFYSPAGVTQLPTACAVYAVSSQSVVSGTLNNSPSWSGAAGSGWVSCSYSGVTLPAGDYKVAVVNGAASPVVWNATTGPNYWASPGPAASGITSGPLSAPSNAAATAPGQSTYNLGATIAYPLTHAGPYTYWVDVQVTPVAAPAAAPQGSWWQLLDVRKQAQEEFDWYADNGPFACPNDGEPLRNAPPTEAGASVEKYCPFDGWQYPRDWIRPQKM